MALQMSMTWDVIMKTDAGRKTKKDAIQYAKNNGQNLNLNFLPQHPLEGGSIKMIFFRLVIEPKLLNMICRTYQEIQKMNPVSQKLSEL